MSADGSGAAVSADGSRVQAGVIGGGVMGSGIAHACLLAGYRVTLVERDADMAARGREAVERALAASAERGRLAEPPQKLAERLLVVQRLDALVGCELAIEAVYEDAATKTAVLTDLEGVLNAKALIASNTSSISIGELSVALRHPSRFVGLHFFNPVPASALVEIIVGAHSSAAVVQRAQQVVAALGKEAITVQDSPGFASSRLGVALGLEAIRMLEEGVASPADIDSAMLLGYKHPLGPLRLTDLVGLDVRLAIAEYLHRKLGERFHPPKLLREKVRAGELGRKSGVGFFRYQAPNLP